MFYLKAPNKSGTCLIYIQFAFHHRRLIYSTSLTLDPKHWDSARKRARRTFDYHLQYNAILDKHEKAVNQAYYELLIHGVPSKDDLRAKVDSILNPANPLSVVEFIKSWIVEKKKTNSVGSMSGYNQLLSKVVLYKPNSVFTDINASWLIGFQSFMLDSKLGQNTALKLMQLFRSMMSSAVDKGLHSGQGLKVIPIKRVETTQIFMDIKELEAWAVAPVHGVYELARDIFVVASFTGVRVSDIPKINKSSFVEHNSVPYFRFSQHKTKDSVMIPAHPIVLGLMEKYNWEVPFMKHQKYNLRLKTVGEKAKLDQLVTFTSYPGGKKLDQDKPKYSGITSHTARRNLICNMYIAGIPVETIKKISGHRSHEAFMRYLRLTPSDHLEMAYQSPFFQG